MFNPLISLISGRQSRLSFTFTSNGKRKFVPREFLVYLSITFIISTNKLVVLRNFLSIRIVLRSFYLLISYFKKFST